LSTAFFRISPKTLEKAAYRVENPPVFGHLAYPAPNRGANFVSYAQAHIAYWQGRPLPV